MRVVVTLPLCGEAIGRACAKGPQSRWPWAISTWAPPYPRGQGFVLPVSWWATGAQRLFPPLEADLEIMPLGPNQTMLTLMGRYEPPLGAVGRAMDRLMLHRIAEACVRRFLHRTAANLELATAA